MSPFPQIGRPQLSVVTTMYRSAPYVKEFYDRAERAAATLFADVEFVFVNDGSPDDSLAIALDIAEADRRVRVVDLSRNFGHHHAIVAALEHARGELIFLIDCDLEEEPESLAKLLEQLREHRADVSYGVQVSRKGGAIERLGGALAYRLVDALSTTNVRLPRNMMLARVMTRRYVDRFLQHRESVIVFSGLAATTGFRQIAVPLEKRSKGSTTYNFRRRLKMLVHLVTAFSDRPLHYIAYLGLFILTVSLLYTAYLVAMFLAYRTVPAGYTSLAVSVWIRGGLILFAIGIVAIYLSVVFVEVKHRPRYIVRAVYDSSQRAEKVPLSMHDRHDSMTSSMQE